MSLSILKRRALAGTALAAVSGCLLAAPAPLRAEPAAAQIATQIGPQIASAEADALDREAVIVTGYRKKEAAAGTKTATPLMETPQSITVIDTEELQRRNALSLNQALGYVAGVSPNQRGAMVTRYDQMILRGFAPGLYLDGMRLIAGPYSTPQIDFNRVDHIDVVKGPASVLYGNSTPGGMVNLTSKRPEDTAFGQAELQLGNYSSRRAAIDVNQPLDEQGTLLFRLVGGWQKADGLTDMTHAERYHVSPMLTVRPADTTDLTLIATYQRAPSGGGYSGVPAWGSALDNPLGQFPRDINTGDPNYERYDHRAKSIAAFLRHEFNDNLTARSNLRFQNNWLSYRQMYVGGYATTGQGANRNTDFGTITRGGGGADEDFDTLTLDNHLNAAFETGALKHNLLGGVDFQKISGENFQQFNTGVTANPLTSLPNLNLFAPVYGTSVPSFDLTQLSPAYVNTDGTRKQWGIYLQNQMSFDALQLIASGRYDWYDQKTLDKKTTVTTKLSQTAFTMRFGALYELPFGLAPYASYSESFEPQAGQTYDGKPFEPVTGRQFEGGLKYQTPNGKAIFTASVYDLRRQKVPVGHPEAGTNGIPNNAQVQIGEVRIRGAEFEARGEVDPGLDVVAALTYTDALITKGAPAAGINPTTTGTPQLGTPKWLFSSFVTYDLGKAGVADGPLAGLTVGGGVRYVGGSYGSTTYLVVNGASVFTRFRTQSFWLWDAMLSYDLGRIAPDLDGLSLALNAQNLLDTRHVTACPFNNSCYFGAGRTVTATLRYRW